MKFKEKYYKWVYLAFSLIAAIVLGSTFYTETSPLTQFCFLTTTVGYAFVSGMYFDSDLHD